MTASEDEKFCYFCYSRKQMNTFQVTPSPLAPETIIKNLLEWLALAHGRTGSEDANQLHQQLLQLRQAPIPTAQRIKFLDLLYGQTERVVIAELRTLHEISLPASRKLRQRMKLLLDLLATLTQDYFNTLAELFDPESQDTPRSPHLSLRRSVKAIAWQIRINHLLASPPGIGLWQQLHAAFRTARRLGLESVPGPGEEQSIQRIYTNILLAAIAQPASFSSAELEFINDYIEQICCSIKLEQTPPLDSTGIFWIDLSKDFPAHALIRRMPAAHIDIFYFSCDAIAKTVTQHQSQLKKGIPAATLGLPAFAETHAGKAVLRRLVSLWGHPSKRKFPRRRQSYRVHLCAGLGKLWQLIKSPASKIDLSEWMITNESPDGYALMHISGQTEDLRVGDIVALQPTGEQAEAVPVWQVCIIRWAISENPEHVELGLELLAPSAVAAEIAHPLELASGSVAALILPETPPLRMTESLVLPTGILKENTRQIIVLVEKDNLEIRQIHATHLDEQTSTIEIFSVQRDDLT